MPAIGMERRALEGRDQIIPTVAKWGHVGQYMLRFGVPHALV